MSIFLLQAGTFGAVAVGRMFLSNSLIINSVFAIL